MSEYVLLGLSVAYIPDWIVWFIVLPTDCIVGYLTQHLQIRLWYFLILRVIVILNLAYVITIQAVCVVMCQYSLLYYLLHAITGFEFYRWLSMALAKRRAIVLLTDQFVILHNTNLYNQMLFPPTFLQKWHISQICVFIKAFWWITANWCFSALFKHNVK